MRQLVTQLLVLLACMSTTSALQADPSGSRLITSAQANRYGLERAWFTQLRLAAGGRGVIDLRLHVSATSAQTIFRVISDQGPTYAISDRGLDTFGQPLGEEGAGKAAAEKIRILHLRGIEAHVDRAVVPDITIYATTDSGVVHAIDAETGRVRWTTAVGSMKYPTTAPAVTEKYLAVVNGQKLYILQSSDGHIIEERRVVGGPGAGPTIVGNTVYVPLLSGQLKAYTFGAEAPWWPLTYRSSGSVTVQPTRAGDRVVWGNSNGDISIITAGKNGIRYRLRLNEDIAGPIIYVPPKQILGVTVSGNVYSFNVENGGLMWRYASGDPTVEPAAIVDDMVFLVTRSQGVHAISTTTGKRVWPSAFEPARHFVAATAKRVYCTTDLGKMIAIDAQTGRAVGEFPLNLDDRIFSNNQTDRIYVATRDGALQCLHELGADLPILHLVDAPKAPADTAKPDGTPEDKAGTKPGPADPFSTDAAAGDAEGGDPFKAGADAKGEAKADADADPFGGK